MTYNSIGDALAGMLDQHKRGMTDHEYELHLRRIKRYANKVQEAEDALTVFRKDEAETAQCIKWQMMLARYQQKLQEELSKGL